MTNFSTLSKAVPIYSDISESHAYNGYLDQSSYHKTGEYFSLHM